MYSVFFYRHCVYPEYLDEISIIDVMTFKLLRWDDVAMSLANARPGRGFK